MEHCACYSRKEAKTMVEDYEQLTHADARNCFYVGFDVSLNHLGMAMLGPEGKLRDYHYITSVKKGHTVDPEHSTHYSAPSARSDHPLHFKRIHTFLDVVDALINDFYSQAVLEGDEPPILICVFEGYAIGSKSSRLFENAELTGVIKHYLVDYQGNAMCSLRVHDPDSVKLFAVGNGHAKKRDVYQQFVEETQTSVYYKEDKSKKDFDGPGTDIADAYFLARLGWLEVQLRKGCISLQEIPENWIRVVNRVTKTYPINLLDRPFVVSKC